MSRDCIDGRSDLKSASTFGSRMEVRLVHALLQGTQDEALQALLNFNAQSESKFEFPELKSDDLRVQLWSAIFNHLKNPSAAPVHNACLIAIRILSRDKTDLESLVCEKWINVLLELSGLYQLTIDDEEKKNFLHNPSQETQIEALKCLFNIIFNSPAAQNLCTKNCLSEGLICRLKIFKDANIAYEIKVFDLRLLFIITALSDKIRCYIKNDLVGIPYLIEILNEILNSEAISDNDCHFLNDQELNMICSILKTLFNLILNQNNSSGCNDEEQRYIERLMHLCNTLLQCETSSQDKTYELHTNIVHFLTGVPEQCFEELAPIAGEYEVCSTKSVFDGRDMTILDILISYYQWRDLQTTSINLQFENLAPILTVLHKAASSKSYLRKYLRSIVLPPLKEVHSRPEEGNTIRNQLCRLLTTPITHVRDLAAQFLFILCKENVSRMVKYTGYGNAAGLFATKGLLGKSKSGAEDAYSSDSEDSDTEEYASMRHTINPVTGCYEAPHVDPMAGCTEEQKEYEAMKLVDLIDQLSKSGMVQPCRIGPDGKPQPVEHILQLQDELPNQQIHKK